MPFRKDRPALSTAESSLPHLDHPVGPFGHGDGSDEQPPAHSLDRSIRPGVPVPVTVLLVEMSSGSMLLQGWRNGPSAYINAEDAVPLRRALADAYGSDRGDEARP